MSVGVTVLAMLAVVGATGLCSINPETREDQTPAVDARTFLELEARAGEIHVRDPQMPQGWKPNAARRTQIGGEPAPRVSWVTQAEGYVESTQTSLGVEEAIAGYDGQYRPNRSVRRVDKTDVLAAGSDDSSVRPLWVADLGDARVVITGAADDADFAAAVRAFALASPIHPAENRNSSASSSRVVPR